MTREEFYASGWSLNTINKVIIHLKNNAAPIFPARLVYPILGESSLETAHQQGEDEFDQTPSTVTSLSLNFEVLTNVESLTVDQSSQWTPSSIPLESVESINRLT
ncbi:hypothetical protein BH09BAC4_BH09BAC4_49730 [soil metagenome]